MTLTSPTLVWVDACPLDRIIPNRGVCALVGNHQVAVFRVEPGSQLFAVSNYDPFSKAFVLSRGIVGTKGERTKVASPVYKQNFDLQTGECIDDPSVSIPTFAVRVNGDGIVQIAHP